MAPSLVALRQGKACSLLSLLSLHRVWRSRGGGEAAAALAADTAVAALLQFALRGCGAAGRDFQSEAGKRDEDAGGGNG